MLSNTPGLRRYSHVLGQRRDAVSRLSRVCPTLRRRGRCRAHEMELAIREAVVAAKEDELRSRATALYTLQREVLQTSDATAASTGAHKNDGGGGDDEEEAVAIARLIDELKSEPAYRHWNVEAEVEARLVAQRVHRCTYAHRPVLTMTATHKRQRHEEQQHNDVDDEEQSEQEHASDEDAHSGTDEPAATTSSSSLSRRQRKQWDEERRRAFASMSAFQQCVVVLLWQRRVRVPRRWLCDVEAVMHDAAEAALRARCATHTDDRPHAAVADAAAVAATTTTTRFDELLDAYVNSDAFAAAVVRAGEALVPHVTCNTTLGLVNVSALPQMVACITRQHSAARPPPSSSSQQRQQQHNNNKSSDTMLIARATWAHFVTATTTANRSSSSSWLHSLFARALSEKEVDMSNDAVAAELVEVLEWVQYALSREEDEGGAATQTMTTTATTAKTTQHSTDSVQSRQQPHHHHHSSRDAAVTWRLIIAQHCQLTDAAALVSALHKRHLTSALLALDLSCNRLSSLRFLFALRAYCGERLLRLSLRDNLITQKPEYAEQVRRCLPRLTSLDGQPIRRPALRLPRPCACAHSLQQQHPCARGGDDGVHAHGSATTTTTTTNNNNNSYGRDTTAASDAVVCIRKTDAQQSTLRTGEAACVVDCVARLLYVWETRRVPRTAREVRAARAARAATAADTHKKEQEDKREDNNNNNNEEEEEEEEELHEDNFWHRYLHPSATFTFGTVAGWTPYDAARMRCERDVDARGGGGNKEDDAAAAVRARVAYTDDDDADGGDKDDVGSRGAVGVMALSAADVREARVFDVAVRTGARNLLGGRPALTRVARGAHDCYTAYQYTLYPASLRVCHHARAATVSVHKLVDTYSSNDSNSSSHVARPTVYVVTMHGVMTWQLPSMRAGQSIAASYDRTLLLVATALPRTAHRAWERRRCPPLQLYSDHVLLRPCVFASAVAMAQANGATTASSSMMACGATVSSPTLSRVLYSAQTRTRVLRLTIEFGLEACDDGVALVCAVVERSTSDAAEHAALDALVYGPPCAATTTTTADSTAAAAACSRRRLCSEDARLHNVADADEEAVGVVLPVHVQRANAAVAALLRRFVRDDRRRVRAARLARKNNDDDDTNDSGSGRRCRGACVFRIFSLLDRTTSSASGVDDVVRRGVQHELPPLPGDVTTTAHADGDGDAATEDAHTRAARNEDNDDDDAHKQRQVHTTATRRAASEYGWGVTPHDVPLQLVNAVVQLMNAHYTTPLSSSTAS